MVPADVAERRKPDIARQADTQVSQSSGVPTLTVWSDASVVLRKMGVELAPVGMPRLSSSRGARLFASSAMASALNRAPGRLRRRSFGNDAHARNQPSSGDMVT